MKRLGIGSQNLNGAAHVVGKFGLLYDIAIDWADNYPEWLLFVVFSFNE